MDIDFKVVSETKPNKTQQAKIDKVLGKKVETEKEKRQRAADATQLY